MNQLKSAVLFAELIINGRSYKDIHAESPEASMPFRGVQSSLLRLPFFDGRGVYIGNLMVIHPELPDFSVSLSPTIFNSRPNGSDQKAAIAELIGSELVSRTDYSYEPVLGLGTPLFRAKGALHDHIERTLHEYFSTTNATSEKTDPLTNSIPELAPAVEEKSKPLASKLAPKITGDAYQVFFIDDLGDATALSDPIATKEEAVQWEKDYWKAYFEKHPGTTLYFCSSEVRSVFIPKETA